MDHFITGSVLLFDRENVADLQAAKADENSILVVVIRHYYPFISDLRSPLFVERYEDREPDNFWKLETLGLAHARRKYKK